ncbi:MAG: ABC transporter ATP-binding protein [Candidatus Aquicultorales bacterium]
MLEVTELTKVFKQAGSDIVAVDDISMSVGTGQFAAILGKSGSGKSTLLSLLGALDKPTRGAVSVDGEEVTKMSERDLVAYRRRGIGFVFQDYSLVPNLTALQNVMLPMEFAGVGRAQRKQRAAALLEQVGIDEEKQARKPRRLSGGEQQRVAIARALANKPRLILADEPTGNLDSETGKVIIDLLREMARSEQTTILVVTHDRDIAKATDLAFRLKDGRLVKEES